MCGCLHEGKFDLLSPTLNYWKQIEFIVLLWCKYTHKILRCLGKLNSRALCSSLPRQHRERPLLLFLQSLHRIQRFLCLFSPLSLHLIQKFVGTILKRKGCFSSSSELLYEHILYWNLKSSCAFHFCSFIMWDSQLFSILFSLEHCLSHIFTRNIHHQGQRVNIVIYYA